MKVVFLGAQITAHFGALDAEGNVAPAPPVSLTLNKLNDTASSEIVQELIRQRDAAQAQQDALSKPETISEE